ncbi:hypothetical protein [Fontibacillus panacisegetis]|uniref:hypothetical protein n=1 Tax=Fontibacillus panacisegetis TaxID=670482 RepID=UPI001113C544|nr:hypothetical protein [Fontibacillus panacisegetis]
MKVIKWLVSIAYGRSGDTLRNRDERTTWQGNVIIFKSHVRNPSSESDANLVIWGTWTGTKQFCM